MIPATMLKRARKGAWPLTLVAAAATGGAAVDYFAPPFADARAQDAQTRALNEGLRSPSFADVVERASPAVVNISITAQIAGTRGTSMPRLPREFSGFEEFFRFFEGAPGGSQPPRQAEGAGSGFIVDPSGYVVTNHHVVESADHIAVTLQDGRRFDAEVVGQDPQTDLALLKVETDSDLPYVQFGDSEQARVGEWVLAIGNPFGLGGSATAGIISARGRTIGGDYDDYLQIDAPINRGNSGGPVFNEEGEVIAVSTAIFSPNGGNVGIGFAIPANQAEVVIAQLKDGGTVARGWLGVDIQQLDADLADTLGLDSTEGALIAGVDEGSPAARAGLEPGDVVVSFDGRRIEDIRTLTREVGLKGPGVSAEVEYLRDGETHRTQVELGNRMAALEGRAAGSGNRSGAPAREVPGAGLSFAPLTDQERSRFGLGADVKGVVVTNVRADSEAADKLQPGDVIVSVNRRPVASVADVQDALERAHREGGRALLLVRRGTQQSFVALDFSAN